MGICSMVARAGAIIGTFSNDHLVNIYHFTFVLCIISFRLEHGNIFHVVVYGIASLFAMLFATVLPETLHKPLPQTVADVERMGLAW